MTGISTVVNVAAELATARADVARLTADRHARDMAVARHVLEAAVVTVGSQSAQIAGTPYSAGPRVFCDAIRALDAETLVKGMEG
jgi:hypothetical protein